jgi:hypothetical protein
MPNFNRAIAATAYQNLSVGTEGKHINVTHIIPVAQQFGRRNITDFK